MIKKLIIYGISLILLVTLSLIFFFKLRPAKEIEKYLNLGNKYLSELKYKEAIIAFNKVISIDSKNIDARLGLADVYIATNEFKDAEIALKEIIELNKQYKIAYDKLLTIYNKDNRSIDKTIDLLKEALNNTNSQDFKEILNDLEPPEVNIPGGTYEKPQTIQFKNIQEGEKIYYSLDNTLPTTASLQYKDNILINKDFITLRAFKINASGIKSKEAIYKYEIFSLKVSDPIASVPSGQYENALTVTFNTLEEGPTIYYTLNNSVPTSSSTKYDKPIAINSDTILRAITINKYGTQSKELVLNYKINPLASLLNGNRTLSSLNPLFDLNKETILSKLGNNFEVRDTGPEGLLKGYYYADLGLMLVFFNSKLQFIQANESYDINGARSNMSFEEIQNILGYQEIKTVISDPGAGPSKYLTYSNINGCSISFSNFHAYEGWVLISKK